MAHPRDYSQDLEALLLAKPQAIKAEMTAVWQDHVGRAIAQGDVGGASSKEESVDVDEAEDISFKNMGGKACSIICLKHYFILASFKI